MQRLKYALTILCLVYVTGLKAQSTTYTAGNLTVVSTAVLSHDSGTCTQSCIINYTITVNSSFAGDSVMVVDTNYHTLVYMEVNTAGASPWTITVPIANNTQSDKNVPAGGGLVTLAGGVYKVTSTADTIFGIDNLQQLYVANPCTYGAITGIVYADLNNNCVRDSGDIQIAGGGRSVFYTENLFGPVPSISEAAGYSSLSGDYSFSVQTSWMTNFTIALQPYFTFIFPPATCSPITYTITTPPPVMPSGSYDFPMQTTHNVDVECWAGSPGNARPNRSFYMEPTVSNLGFDSVSGVLTLIKDSRVTYDASLSSYPADTVHGDTLIWNYTNLTCVAGGAYWNYFMSSIHLTPNNSVNIGDTLCFRIYTGVPTADINPANNDYTICLPVVNSYDPNIKEVSPKGTGATGDIPSTTSELEYTIHFQNTGTAEAYNIDVIDTLSANVDAASLKILGTSHYMFPEWIAPGVVKFKFNDIFLADSFSNEPASHGYVRFKVKMHSGLAPGTQIKNKGYIYFDTNPAVITNEALNTIIHTADVPTTASIPDVKIYPNPATENIFVEHLQNGRLTILSMNGSVVVCQNITSDKTEIDLSRLPAGVYILKTVSKDGATTRKFVKE